MVLVEVQFLDDQEPALYPLLQTSGIESPIHKGIPYSHRQQLNTIDILQSSYTTEGN